MPANAAQLMAAYNAMFGNSVWGTLARARARGGFNMGMLQRMGMTPGGQLLRTMTPGAVVPSPAYGPSFEGMSFSGRGPSFGTVGDRGFFGQGNGRGFLGFDAPAVGIAGFGPSGPSIGPGGSFGGGRGEAAGYGGGLGSDFGGADPGSGRGGPENY